MKQAVKNIGNIAFVLMVIILVYMVIVIFH